MARAADAKEPTRKFLPLQRPLPRAAGTPPRRGGCALKSPLAGRGWRSKEGRGRRGSTPRPGSFRSRPLPCAPRPHRHPSARPCSPEGPRPPTRVWGRGTRPLLSLQVIKSRWKIGRLPWSGFPLQPCPRLAVGRVPGEVAEHGAAPGRAGPRLPAPAPWRPPGLTRQRPEASWRFTLPPRALICRSPWKRPALKQVQAGKAGGRRGMLARRDTGGGSGIPGRLRGSPCPAAHLARGLC